MIYTESWGTTISVHSVTVTQSYDALVLTTSASLSPFIFPWERVSWIFLRLSLCLLSDQVPWLFSVLQLSLGGIYHLPQGPASHLAITRTIWSEWTWAHGRHWATLVLSAFGRLSRSPASCLTIPRTIWSKWTRFGQSTLACCKIALERLFRMVHIFYIINLLYILNSNLILHFPFLHSNIPFKCFLFNSHQTQTLFDYILFSILILEMYSRREQ
jgi:hypothetical protein